MVLAEVLGILDDEALVGECEPLLVSSGVFRFAKHESG